MPVPIKDLTENVNKMWCATLTLSSLGFFEHSQPEGGGGADSAPCPPPTVTLLLMQIK